MASNSYDLPTIYRLIFPYIFSVNSVFLCLLFFCCVTFHLYILKDSKAGDRCICQQKITTFLFFSTHDFLLLRDTFCSCRFINYTYWHIGRIICGVHSSKNACYSYILWLIVDSFHSIMFECLYCRNLDIYIHLQTA